MPSAKKQKKVDCEAHFKIELQSAANTNLHSDTKNIEQGVLDENPTDGATSTIS